MPNSTRSLSLVLARQRLVSPGCVPPGVIGASRCGVCAAKVREVRCGVRAC